MIKYQGKNSKTMGSDADTIFVLDFLHDEGTFERGDVLVTADDVEEELLISTHVGGMDAKQIVEGARNVIALGDFGYLLYHIRKSIGIFVVETAKLDAAIDGKALVELLGIEDRSILLDETKAFEALYALVRRRSRKMYLGCKLLVVETSVLLEGTKDLGVLVIENI